MDNSCRFSNSLVAGTSNFLYFRRVYSRSAGDCVNCCFDQVDQREKTALLIVAKIEFFAVSKTDEAKFF